jgi:hypothetical protein
VSLETAHVLYREQQNRMLEIAKKLAEQWNHSWSLDTGRERINLPVVPAREYKKPRSSIGQGLP